MTRTQGFLTAQAGPRFRRGRLSGKQSVPCYPASASSSAEFTAAPFPVPTLFTCRARKLDHHRGLEQGRGEEARTFTPEDQSDRLAKLIGASCASQPAQRHKRSVCPPEAMPWLDRLAMAFTSAAAAAAVGK